MTDLVFTKADVERLAIAYAWLDAGENFREPMDAWSVLDRKKREVFIKRARHYYEHDKQARYVG